MKQLLTVLTLATIIGFASCDTTKKEVNNLAPKETLSAFLNAMYKKDFETAKKLATKSSGATFDSIAKVKDANTTSMIGKFNPESITLGDPTVMGDSCVVPASPKEMADLNFKFPLRKEDGGWKVVFDESMMAANEEVINNVMKKLLGGLKDMGINVGDSGKIDPKKFIQDLKDNKDELLKESKKMEEALKQK